MRYTYSLKKEVDSQHSIVTDTRNTFGLLSFLHAHHTTGVPALVFGSGYFGLAGYKKNTGQVSKLRQVTRPGQSIQYEKFKHLGIT